MCTSGKAPLRYTKTSILITFPDSRFVSESPSHISTTDGPDTAVYTVSGHRGHIHRITAAEVVERGADAGEFVISLTTKFLQT